MPLTVLGYARVSTAEQAESGLGLDAQERAIREACDRRGWQLVEVLRDEGKSGKSLDRPALEEALRRIAAGEVGGLVVAKLDRLSRSTVDSGLLFEWFLAAGAALVALDFDIDTSTPGGRLVANVMAAVAEWERDQIEDRTRRALAELRAQGRPAGRPAVADAPGLVARIRAMRAGTDGEPKMTLQAIADQLNAEGIPTLRGAPLWRVSAVQAAVGYTRPRKRRQPAILPELGRGRP